jgi:hypothetical protein
MGWDLGCALTAAFACSKVHLSTSHPRKSERTMETFAGVGTADSRKAAIRVGISVPLIHRPHSTQLGLRVGNKPALQRDKSTVRNGSGPGAPHRDARRCAATRGAALRQPARSI